MPVRNAFSPRSIPPRARRQTTHGAIVLKPVFLTICLLVASSTALAAERYTEVWNPPEAQTAKTRAKAHNVVPVQAKKKHKNVTSVKKVADKTSVAQPQSQSVPAPRVKPAPRQADPLMELAAQDRAGRAGAAGVRAGWEGLSFLGLNRKGARMSALFVLSEAMAHELKTPSAQPRHPRATPRHSSPTTPPSTHTPPCSRLPRSSRNA